MNHYGYLILGIIFCTELAELMLSRLNQRHAKTTAAHPPQELVNIYGETTFIKSLLYQIDRSRLSILQRIVNMPVFFGLFISGLLPAYAELLTGVLPNTYIRSAVFFLSYGLLFSLVSKPFSLYGTFVLEKRYGFNRTTPLLYLRDNVIHSLLSSAFMVIMLWSVLFFMAYAGELWWVWAAAFLTAFSFILTYVYPALIAPLFNTFSPLPEGSLKERITAMAAKAEFPLSGIYVMDASRRSAHSNAYFTGFSKQKRIVLYDTLIETHPEDEILAILAHEIGHNKLGHVKKMMAFSIITIIAGMFFLKLLIDFPWPYAAFGFAREPYLGIFIVSILLSPLGFAFTPLLSAISRRHEYAADRYSVTLTEQAVPMRSALIRLHRDNLSNPYPHPLFSFVYYSHPTLGERLSAMQSAKV